VISLLAPAQAGAFINKQQPNFYQSTNLELEIYFDDTHLFFNTITARNIGNASYRHRHDNTRTGSLRIDL
jgi:hypothetical protein